MNAEQFIESARPIADFPWLKDATDFLTDHMDQDGGHDLSHLLRVLRNADVIARGESLQGWETLAMAVVFHDSVNLPKNHPERHLASTYSAELGAKFAQRWLGPEDLPVFVDAIRSHSHSAGIQPSFEVSRALADADRLESLGAFGIARTFYVSGVMGRSIVSMHDPFATARELDDLTFAVDHFFRKLLQLRDMMFTVTGRAMADQRHAFLVTFLDQLSSEIGVPNPAM